MCTKHETSQPPSLIYVNLNFKGSSKPDMDQTDNKVHQLSRIESEPMFPPKELEDSLRSTGNLLDSDYLTESKKSNK